MARGRLVRDCRGTWSVSPLALGLRALQAGPGSRAIHWESMMALSVLMTVPVLVLFFIAQRSYMKGIVITGVKG